MKQVTRLFVIILGLHFFGNPLNPAAAETEDASIAEKLIVEAPPTSRDLPIGYRKEPISYRQEPIGFREHPIGYRQEPLGFREHPIGYRETPSGFLEEITNTLDQPRGFAENPPNFIEKNSHPLVNTDGDLKIPPTREDTSNIAGNVRKTPRHHYRKPQT